MIKDNVDLDNMKEFEKQINSEKDPIKFHLLFKINSYHEPK